jgi:hypothetical protein
MLNFSYYADNRTVDHGFRKPPLPTKAGGLVLRQNLTYRFALETGISVIGFGYKSVYTSPYPGGKRWEAQSTSINGIGRIQVPVRVLWLLPKINKPWRKYLSLGANGYYNEYWDLKGNVGGEVVFLGLTLATVFRLEIPATRLPALPLAWVWVWPGAEPLAVGAAPGRGRL